MKTVFIDVGMNQRGTVTIPGDSLHGHRGLWFYDPTVVGREVEVGDTVVFTCLRTDVVAVGRCEELVRPEQYPKFCSRLNTHGFRWGEMPEWDADLHRLIDETLHRTPGNWAQL